MTIQSLKSYLSSFTYSRTNEKHGALLIHKYDNQYVCEKIEYILRYEDLSQDILSNFLDRKDLKKEDYFEIINIYLKGNTFEGDKIAVSELIDIPQKYDINEFIKYGIENFGYDKKLGYYNVVYIIEKNEKDKYLQGEISKENYDLLYNQEKDVNSYIDEFRLKKEKYDLENRDDYLVIYEIIKNVSYFNIGEYKEQEYGRVDNEGFYDKFNTCLSLENYKFLYNNYYKYNNIYLHSLYFEKYSIEGEYSMGYGFAGSNYSSDGNNLALDILGNFNDIFSQIDIKGGNIEKGFLKFLVNNLKSVDWSKFLEQTDKLGIDLDYIKILIKDYGLINDNILNAGINIDQQGLEEFIYKNYIKDFRYLEIIDGKGPKYVQDFKIVMNNIVTIFKDFYTKNEIKIVNKDLDIHLNSILFDFIREYSNNFFHDSYDYLKRILSGNYVELNSYDIIEGTDIKLLISFFNILDIDISCVKDLKPGFEFSNPLFKGDEYYANEVNYFISEKTDFGEGDIIDNYDFSNSKRILRCTDIKLPFPSYMKEQLDKGYEFTGQSFKKFILNFLNNSFPEFYDQKYFSSIFDEYYCYNGIRKGNQSNDSLYKAGKFLLKNDTNDIFKIIDIKPGEGGIHPKFDTNGELKPISQLEIKTKDFFVSGFEELFKNIDFLGVYFDNDLTKISNYTKKIALNLLLLDMKIPFLLDDTFYFIGEYMGGTRFSHNIYDDYASKHKM